MNTEDSSPHSHPSGDRPWTPPEAGSSDRLKDQRRRFYDTPQYRSLQSHDPQSKGDLPLLMEAISLVGTIDDMELRTVAAKTKEEGVVRIMEPLDGIVSGRASMKDIHDFLVGYMLTRIQPSGAYIVNRRQFRIEDVYAVIWHRTDPQIRKLVSDEEGKIDAIKSLYEGKAQDWKTEKGGSELKGNIQLKEYDDGITSIWKEYAAFIDEIHKETITSIRRLARQAFEEMEGALKDFVRGEQGLLADRYALPDHAQIKDE